jgi:hypothetical protein
MKITKLCCASWMFLFLVVPMMVYAGNIKTSAIPSNILVLGQHINVPVVVDISKLPEKLGSYTAEISWNANALKYVSYGVGSAEGFSNPFVNTSRASQGKLVFAAANPHGAEGLVNILNIKFEVIGTAGQSCGLDLKFKAMASAYTFYNLLPYVETLTGVDQDLQIKELPKEFTVLQNYPNPFNPSTKITYKLPDGAQVNLWIYNLLGQKIRTLVNEFKAAGNYDINWDGKDDAGKEMPAGIYIYKLQAGSFTDMKKMELVK